MRFMLYTVCKTLRLSVFNKELFDLTVTGFCLHRHHYCDEARVNSRRENKGRLQRDYMRRQSNRRSL